jgi:hypothetical protein
MPLAFEAAILSRILLLVAPVPVVRHNRFLPTRQKHPAVMLGLQELKGPCSDAMIALRVHCSTVSFSGAFGSWAGK